MDESKVLKPRDPRIENEDDWEEFQLEQVEVQDEESGQLKSLLLANEKSPLLVRGKLKLQPDQHKYLVHREDWSAGIAISDVQRFAYGQYDSGEVAFWAGGQAGWFKVRPSRTYKSIYRDMEEAIRVLYFLADFFREHRGKKRQRASMDTILKRYAEQPEFRCSSEEDAAEVFHKHKTFLLSCMVGGKEGLDWRDTSIYEYLNRETPESSETEGEEEAGMVGTPNDDSDGGIARRLASKGKSVLRPRSGKYSMKGPRRHIEDEDDADTPSHARGSPPLKRKSSTSHQRTRSGKRSRLLDADEDGDTPMLSPQETSGSNSSAPAITNTPLPLRDGPTTRKPNNRRRDGPSKNGPELGIETSILPSFEPQGPGDTWTCTTDGCMHRVYNARSPAARQLIKEHYQTHAMKSQTQLDVALSEERPYLPVGNLIKKIRDMAAAATGKLGDEAT